MIIIPAAGRGRRFQEAGYKEVKHMIPILGKPMWQWVRDNVQPLDPHGEVYLADEYMVGRTRGAVETLYRAFVQADPLPGDPVVVANCDQLISIPEDFRSIGVGHGVIFTFKSASPAHSYVETNGQGMITSIVEKPQLPASNQAVAGVYLFTNPSAIFSALKFVLESGAVGELYLSAALSWMIDQGYTLYAVDVPTCILGTPEDFQRFEVAAKTVQELQVSGGLPS